MRQHVSSLSTDSATSLKQQTKTTSNSIQSNLFVENQLEIKQTARRGET